MAQNKNTPSFESIKTVGDVWLAAETLGDPVLQERLDTKEMMMEAWSDKPDRAHYQQHREAVVAQNEAIQDRYRQLGNQP